MTETVNHPPHYAHKSGYEAIDLCEYMTFNTGNALKYVWRAGLKTSDPREDLRKARWYLNRELNPPRIGMLDWLWKALAHLKTSTIWPRVFEVLRTNVTASDGDSLVGRFLRVLGDGDRDGVARALAVVEEKLKELDRASPERATQSAATS